MTPLFLPGFTPSRIRKLKAVARPMRCSAVSAAPYAPETPSRTAPVRTVLPLPGLVPASDACRTALLNAVTEDDPALLRAALEKTARLGRNPDFRDLAGETPLACAVRLGRALMVLALLAAGADIRQRVGRDREPLLSAALREGKKSTALTLLSCGAPARDCDRHGVTPLHWACARGNTPIAEELIRAGADPGAGDSRGLTPLHVAAYFDREDLCRLLAECGASPDAKTAGGLTPADCAVRRGAFRALSFLTAPEAGGTARIVLPAHLSPRMEGLLASRGQGLPSP